MKIFNFIKEVLQYAGIIILSCLSKGISFLN